MTGSLIELSDQLADVVASVDASVVSVGARRHYPASGFRLADDVVVTANHAVRHDEDIAVTSSDGTTVTAKLAGRDPGSDLAILRVEGGPATHKAAAHRQAVQVRPGEIALVVGRSPDSGVNASLGIVSAVSGPWRTWRGRQLDAYIRLDAKFFPQSSGGAVINARGELIGVATPALSRIAGLAVPYATVKRVAATLLEKGYIPRGYLGVGLQPVPLSDELRQRLGIANPSGLIALTVESDGPAGRAGLLIGDVLIGAGETAIADIDDLQALSEATPIGARISLRFIRGGKLQEAALTVGERPRG